MALQSNRVPEKAAPKNGTLVPHAIAMDQNCSILSDRDLLAFGRSVATLGPNDSFAGDLEPPVSNRANECSIVAFRLVGVGD
jgi:hypothetical protein